MPSELVTAAKTDNNENTNISEEKVTITDSDSLAALQVEKDEERSALAAEYNEILTNKDTTTEEKNNAYEGLKKIDEIKSKEESLESKLKEELKLDSFIKIDGNNVNVTVKKQDHDYSLANNIMRIIQEEYENKMYISVKFQK